MSFLVSQDQLREIQWSTGFLWDIKFENCPAPFDVFFPATDVEEGKAILESKEFITFLSGIKIPLRSGVKPLRLTFNDDEQNTLSDWLDDWYNRLILNGGQFMSTVDKSAKLVTLQKLNSRREEISTISYWVFPEGELIFNGISGPDIRSYSQEFVIVGQVTPKKEFPENDS